MRLIEETMGQADKQLKDSIEAYTDLFIEVVKRSSAIKGIRWDDIVVKFEYQGNEKPKLIKFIQAQTFSQQHKDFLIARLEATQGQEVDLEGLEGIVNDIEMIEKDFEQHYDKIFDKAANASHERIKHS